MGRKRMIAGLAIALLGLAGCGGAGGKSASTPSATKAPTPRMVAAVKQCDVSEAVINDAGKTLDLHTRLRDSSDYNTPVEGVFCILKALGGGTAVEQHVKTTRALDGQQTEEWSGIRARWTYHPDDGLQMTVQDTK